MHSTIYNTVRKIKAFTEVDAPVLLASLYNTLSLFAGPISAFIVATYFSPALQGYYYTFGSIVNLRTIAEIGLGQAIIQFASHEWAGLRLNDRGEIVGDPVCYSRLVNLTKISIKWYTCGAILLIPALSLGGYALFSSGGPKPVGWKGPWLAFCLVVGISFVFVPLFSLLQGCGQVAEFWFYRIIQRIVSVGSLWLLILHGYELWSLPISVVCNIIWSLTFLVVGYRGFIRSLLSSRSDQGRVNWRKEIWPLQWRIAVANFASMSSAQFFVPILFHFRGPLVAGQTGLTISLSLMIYAFATSWMLTKAPRFGSLVARRRFEELDRSFSRAIVSSTAIAGLGAVFTTAVIASLGIINVGLASRVLPALPAGFFFMATVIAAFVAGLSLYLRAYKEEPFATVYVVSTLLAMCLASLVARRYSALGVSCVYFLILSFVQLPWALWVFRTRRQIYRQDLVV